MSKTQRFRRLFLLLLIIWGIAGGLVSLHTCMDNSERKQEVSSCCCDEGHQSIKNVSQGDCCKTVTSYVGIPLYFVDTNSPISFFDSATFISSEIVSPIVEHLSLTFIAVHPPPENLFLSGLGKCILAMRI